MIFKPYSFGTSVLIRTARQWMICMAVLLAARAVEAQDPMSTIQQYLNGHLQENKLLQSDVSEWLVTSQHVSRQSGVMYVYIRQLVHGLPVSNGVANFAIKGDKVITMGSNLVSDLHKKAQYSTPVLNPIQAIQAAAAHLKINAPRELVVVEPISPGHFIYSSGGISTRAIPVELAYRAISDTEVRLVWDMDIYALDGLHWWTLGVDAQTGQIVHQHDMVVHCSFDHAPFSNQTHPEASFTPTATLPLASASGNPDQYTVFPLPAESPNHGARATVISPADFVASPYGWHDTDGIPGPDYTITRGNNAYAYEDVDDDDLPGFSPDGTDMLDFNFPYNPLDPAANYQAAAITNLFYMNNMMHDIWYQYGFDEESGNFQANNYQVGGPGDDYVLAEAQDGGGLNNANFGTPPDGFSPRMQMYLWNNTVPANFLVINSPSAIAGSYLASAATFGPALSPVSITEDIVLIEDDAAPVEDGCEVIVNGTQLAGKVVMIDRGSCTFVEKVQAAQDAGAIAVIIVNNIPGDPTQMGGASGTITIPSIMISQADGNVIKAQMLVETVNASINDAGGAVTGVADGDFDNGIIAHEYGHGISTRLVGGADVVDCLFNAEQMGEGWSDWFGLMLTMEPGDKGTDARGIGTYAIAQAPGSTGIRPAPYSTDFSINGYTYAASNDVNGISEPHGIGFIFATMLWDLNWALIDAYGGTPDPDVYTGTGGNNIAMKLVIEGLKITTCNPGMVNGRDAILMADEFLYGGEHTCLIWEVFARRGLGASADQGLSTSRTDQIEAFDLPTTCLTAIEPPVADFASDTLLECTRTVVFTDKSTSIPQAWYWDFGDGNTSELRNPTHTYTNGGTYFVKLKVTNTIGSDSTLQAIHIVLPPSPVTEDMEACSGSSVSIPTEATGTAYWRDTMNTIVFIGDTLVIPDLNTKQTYYVENQIGEPSQNIGPLDGSIGGGGYHGSGYHGAINFTAERDFVIISAWVDAQNAGPRTFVLGSGTNLDGVPPSGVEIIDQVTVDIPAGQQRVQLNLSVPAAGDYNIGASLSQSTSLYRNNNGPVYPYVLPGLLTMTSSSSFSVPTGFYYYVYDLEVRPGELCISDPDTVTVTPVVSLFEFEDGGNATLSFTDASIGATSWAWEFGDGQSSTEQNPVHTYDEEGVYTITLTINDGICASSQTYDVLISSSTDGTRPLALTLQPNPASGLATIRLNEAVTEDLDIRVRDYSGKLVHTYLMSAGKRELSFDVNEWPAAVYAIQINGKSYAEVRKLVVNR